MRSFTLVHCAQHISVFSVCTCIAFVTVRDQDKLAVSVLSCGGAGNKTTNSLIRGQAVSLIAKIYCET